MSAVKKAASLKVADVFQDGQWHTVSEVMSVVKCGYSVAANATAKLIAKGILKKSKYGTKRVMFYALTSAPDLYEGKLEDLSEAQKAEFDKRTEITVPKRKKGAGISAKSPKKLNNVKPSDKPKVDPLAGAPKNALAAIEAIGSLAEENAMMKNLLVQIHKQTGAVLKQLS